VLVGPAQNVDDVVKSGGERSLGGKRVPDTHHDRVGRGGQSAGGLFQDVQIAPGEPSTVRGDDYR